MADQYLRPADPRLRRRASLLTLLLLIAGTIALLVLHGYLGSMRELYGKDEDIAFARLIQVVRLAAIVSSICFLALGFWLWRLGRSVLRTGEFPPPGARLVKDTAVRTGPRARTIGNLLLLAAAALAVLGPVGTWYLSKVAIGRLTPVTHERPAKP